jgi:hypothetical protein
MAAGLARGLDEAPARDALVGWAISTAESLLIQEPLLIAAAALLPRDVVQRGDALARTLGDTAAARIRELLR